MVVSLQVRPGMVAGDLRIGALASFLVDADRYLLLGQPDCRHRGHHLHRLPHRQMPKVSSGASAAFTFDRGGAASVRAESGIGTRSWPYIGRKLWPAHS